MKIIINCFNPYFICHVIIYILLLYFPMFVGCSNSDENNNIKEPNIVVENNYKGDHQMYIDYIEIATKKAQELGYVVKDMNIKSKKQNEIIVVYFSPKQKGEVIIVGGDLNISLDFNTKEITDIKQGQ